MIDWYPVPACLGRMFPGDRTWPHGAEFRTEPLGEGRSDGQYTAMQMRFGRLETRPIKFFWRTYDRGGFAIDWMTNETVAVAMEALGRELGSAAGAVGLAPVALAALEGLVPL